MYLVVEAGLVLEELAIPDWSTLTKVGDACKSVQLVAEEANDEALVAADSHAIFVSSPLICVDPLAVSPQRSLHRAALGHFNAIERVTVRPEEASNEIVSAAELASTCVELLPPVLVVAPVVLDCPGDGGVCLEWPLANATVQVVERILSARLIGLHADEQVAVVASGPAPLVHGLSPEHLLLGTLLLHTTPRCLASWPVVHRLGVAHAEATEAVAKSNLRATISGLRLAIGLAIGIDACARAQSLPIDTTAGTIGTLAAATGEVAHADTLATLGICDLASLLVGIVTRAALVLAILSGGHIFAFA